MTHLLEDFHDFLQDAPTSWHATLEMGNRLASCDFTPLLMNEKWPLEKGGKYFVIDDGSIAAFILPKNAPKRLSIIAAHTDSPALKLKPCPEILTDNMLQLGVEVYGGPILPTWVNRDLVITGKVTVEQKKGTLFESLVYFDDAPVLIPLLAPHLDKEASKKGLLLNQQDHLKPIACLLEDKLDVVYLESLLRRHLSFHKLVDFELFLVPLEPPRFIGKNGELLASYRLDNLASAHAGLTALGNIKNPHSSTLLMGIFWDHEEVGSSTRSGAGSPLFRDIFDRICSMYSMPEEDKVLLRHHSTCLSVDVAHAFNPNYAKKYDPKNSPRLGQGIVIKYNGNMRYGTTAPSGSKVIQLCERLNLHYQKQSNRSDIPSGSTIGPLFATQMGIETADIGIAELSMHAAREVIACQDHVDMCMLLSTFLEEE